MSLDVDGLDRAGPPVFKMWYIAGMPVVERNYALVANSLLWTTLAFIVLMLRLFTRAFIVKRVGVDDYLMTGAMVCPTSLCTTLRETY